MINRPPGCLPMILVILLLGAGLTGVLRSGYLISIWSFYRLAGIQTGAVIEHCEQYRYIVRKPRPSRYVNGYRGTYEYDVDTGGKSAAHYTGRFDTSNFIGSTGEECRPGSSISVLYSRFNPSISRPAGEVKKAHLLIPILCFIPSLFALLLSAIFIYFNLSGSAWADKRS